MFYSVTDNRFFCQTHFQQQLKSTNMDSIGKKVPSSYPLVTITQFVISEAKVQTELYGRLIYLSWSVHHVCE